MPHSVPKESMDLLIKLGFNISSEIFISISSLWKYYVTPHLGCGLKPIALRTAKLYKSFGRFECNRVNEVL